jgi:dTMP kinase
MDEPTDTPIKESAPTATAPAEGSAATSQVESPKGGFGRLMRNAEFVKLWIAQFVSAMGDWLIIGILIPTVTKLSGGSSMAVAGILIVKIVPSLFLSQFTGSLVDRFDRKKIMLAADAIRFFLVMFLLFTNSLFVIYAVVLLMETFSLFFYPARNALVPHIVHEHDVSLTNGFMYTTQQAAMIVGLATSGAIMAAFDWLVRFVVSLPLGNLYQTFTHTFTPILLGSKAGYFVDALTFVISATCIFLMRINAKPPHAGEPVSFKIIGKDAAESIKFLIGHEELRGLLLSVFIGIVGGGAIVPVGLNYIASLDGKIPLADRLRWLQTFSASRQIFILTFLAFGMAVAAALVPRLEKRLNVRLLFPTSLAVFAAGMVGFAFTGRLAIAAIYAVGAGACISLLYVTGNNYIIQNVSDDIRGRVFTSLEAVIRISLLVSMVVTAPVSDFVGKFLRIFLNDHGMTKVFGLPLTGERLTLIFGALIVACAAYYGFKKLYLEGSAPSAPPR